MRIRNIGCNHLFGCVQICVFYGVHFCLLLFEYYYDRVQICLCVCSNHVYCVQICVCLQICGVVSEFECVNNILLVVVKYVSIMFKNASHIYVQCVKTCFIVLKCVCVCVDFVSCLYFSL
jgi:hypothetical protein